MKKLLFIIQLAACAASVCQVTGQSETAGSIYYNARELYDAGDFDDSRQLLEQLLDRSDSLSDYNLALIRNTLGLDLYETGYFRAAIREFRLADSLNERTGIDGLKLKVSIYNNQALWYNWMGDFTNCFSYYDKALRLVETIPHDQEAYSEKLSMILFNRGLALINFDRLPEALEFLKRSERIKEEQGHAYLGSVYFNMARVYETLADTLLAREYYLKSIGRWIEESGEDFFQLGNVYLHYGLFLTACGSQEEGQHYIDRAIHNYIFNYGVRHPLTAEGYQHLAGYYMEHANYGKALEMTQQSLISNSIHFKNRDPYSNPGEDEALHDLTLLKDLVIKTDIMELMAGETSDLKKKQEHTLAALETNTRARNVLYRIRDEYLSSESRGFLMAGQRDIFSSGIRLNLQAYRLTGNESYKGNAFVLAARGKSNELLYEIREKEQFYLESHPDSLTLQVMELRQDIDRISNNIQKELQRDPPDSARLANIQELLFTDRRMLEGKMNELVSEHPLISRFDLNRKEFSPEWVRKRLGRNESLLEYYMTGSGQAGSKELYIFVVTKRSLHIQKIPLDTIIQAHLDKVIRDLHFFPPSEETSTHFDTLKVFLNEAYTALIQPVESYIEGSRLVISPDEELAYLPFEVLLTDYTRDSLLNYAGLPYLMDKYAMSYLYNTQILKIKRRPGILFPNVDIFLPDNHVEGSVGPDRLEGAIREAEEILDMTRGNALNGNTGLSGIEKEMQGKSIIHMAMHAYASSGDRQRPYFLFGPTSDSVLSNRLYDYEVSAMKLSSPMVVLSSCSSGGGYLEQGEGIMSLSRSFILGGAATVIYSLWPVDDAMGQDLVTRFYQKLRAGKSVRKALSLAKREYLIQSRPSNAHPYYWAAFQVTGDPAPIAVNRWFVPAVALGILLVLAGIYFSRSIFFRRERASSLKEPS